MRVLELFKRMNHGGAEMRSLDRLRHPPLSRIEHHIATLSTEPGALDRAFEDAGSTLHPCPFDAGFPLRFHQLLRRIQPDVVHANQQWMSGFFLSLARTAGVRGRVCQFHASNDLVHENPARRARNRVLRRTLRHTATAVTGVSAGVMDALWYPDWRTDPRCSVTYLGVDLARFGEPQRAAVRADLGLPKDAEIAVHVGNMGPPKNHPGLGALFAELAAARPRLHLLAVGRRDVVIEAAMRTAAGSAANRLHTLGPRDDVPDLLAAADLFLLPSVNEGLPTVVLEARAARLPCVVSDLAGNLEIATHLSGVRCLPLGPPWSAWTRACIEALDQQPPAADAANPLLGTPFDAAHSAQAHVDLWRRSLA